MAEARKERTPFGKMHPIKMGVGAMSLKKTVQITIGNRFVVIDTTEICPGRWGWTVAIDGGGPLRSKVPQPTAAAALLAAEMQARALINAEALPS